jgi:hypothetical protein
MLDVHSNRRSLVESLNPVWCPIERARQGSRAEATQVDAFQRESRMIGRASTPRLLIKAASVMLLAAAGVAQGTCDLLGEVYVTNPFDQTLMIKGDGSAANRVMRDVRVAYLAAATAFERLDLTEQLLKQAQLALDLAQGRYDLGLSSIVELSQAQLNLTSAQIANASARYDYQAQRVVVDYQIGSLR